MEERKVRKFNPYAAGRYRRRQQSWPVAQRAPRRSRRRPGRFARAEKSHHLQSQRSRVGRGKHHHRRIRGAPNLAKIKGRQSPRHRRISLEQNRALMRILKLTPAVEKKLLRARQERDREAERVAAEIIADVRNRGDVALFAWAEKLDHS